MKPFKTNYADFVAIMPEVTKQSGDVQEIIMTAWIHGHHAATQDMAELMENTIRQIDELPIYEHLPQPCED